MQKILMGAAAAALALGWGAALAQPPAAAPAGPPPQAPMTVKQIKPNVYMVVGNGGNSTVAIGPTGVVLVDTKNPGRAIYDELIKTIQSVTPLPVKEVIITHHHGDHSGNSVYFEAAGIPVVGHEAEMAALQTYAPAGNAPHPVPPSIVYDDKLDVEAGGVTAVVHHYAAGHTAGDSVVYFPALKIVSGGDEVVAVTPNVDYPFGGSVLGWVKSLDAIAKLDFDDIIPGHGADPISKADFLAYKTKWDTLVARGKAAVKGGATKAQLLAAIKTDDLGWSINTPLWQQPARLDGFYKELAE